MSSTANLHDISYFEYRVINELTRAHAKEYKNALRAVIAFGPLKTSGDTYDIDLLEVVAGWQGDRVAEFSSDAQLPMRGKLRLFFLNPDEFEELAQVSDPDLRQWVQDLIRRVREGYEVVLESPPGYVESILEKEPPVSTLTAPGSGLITMPSPLLPPALTPSRRRRR